MQKCPHCGGGVARAKKEQARVVAGTCFVVRASAFCCRRCRAVFMPGAVLERVDIEIATVIAMRAAISGQAFRFMRKSLGMRGFEIAALLDVTGETISRWEHGQRPVDSSAWVLVGSLVLEHAGRPPATLRRLLSLKKRAKMPKTVRLDVTDRRSAVRTAASARTPRTRVSGAA